MNHPEFESQRQGQEKLDEIEHLASSEALDELVRDVAQDRKTLWTTDENEIIEINDSRIPSPITEGLYFGARTQISDISARLNEFDIEGRKEWNFDMKFTSSGFEYKILGRSTKSPAIIQGYDPYGNQIRSKIPHEAMLNFMLALYYEKAFRTRENEDEVDIAAMAQSFEANPDYIINDALRYVLWSFPEVCGIAQQESIARLPRGDAGETIYITKKDIKSQSQEVTNLEIDLVRDNKDTDFAERITLRTGSKAITNGKDGMKTYAQVSDVFFSADQFDEFRSIPELLDENPLVKTVESYDIKFKQIATTCLEALAPSLRPYQTTSEDELNSEFIPLDDETTHPSYNDPELE